jgi:hypothetical protein
MSFHLHQVAQHRPQCPAHTPSPHPGPGLSLTPPFCCWNTGWSDWVNFCSLESAYFGIFWKLHKQPKRFGLLQLPVEKVRYLFSGLGCILGYFFMITSCHPAWSKKFF